MNNLKGKYDLNSLIKLNEKYHSLYGIKSEDVDLVNEWVKRIESRLSQHPKAGDRINIVSREGIYSGKGRIDIQPEGNGLRACYYPQIPIICKREGGYGLSLSGGTFENIQPELLEWIREVEAEYSLFGSVGKVKDGTLKFTANVSLFTYKQPHPEYSDYSTRFWAKYSVYKSPQPEKESFLYQITSCHENPPVKREFKTQEEFDRFVWLRKGEVIAEGINYYTLWCYKDVVQVLDTYIYNLINLPEQEISRPDVPSDLSAKVYINHDLKRLITIYPQIPLID